LLLTFRNRPLARLSPVAPRHTSMERDPALDFGERAENLPTLTNEAIDAAIYG
jgi:antitoxin (DNA-binding transcriptional repressor) of toxin-antitoxin stability system